MTNDLKRTVRALEEATAAGDAPADRLDPQTASLREAWLAFGEMLEAAQPPVCISLLSPGEEPTSSTLLLEEKSSVRALHTRRRWQRLLATGLLAASLLIGVATVWVLRSADRQENPTAEPRQIASTNPKVDPSTQAHTKAVPADEPQWDDSFDEQFAQVGWQMTCVRQNQFFRTDAFGIVQYRVEQFRQAIQTDSL